MYAKTPYHIYEMNIDGTELRQITDGPFHDLDPLYLPDGRIGFTSSRCKSRALCFWVHAATLFAMNADGGTVDPIFRTMHVHPTLGEVVKSAADAARP